MSENSTFQRILEMYRGYVNRYGFEPTDLYLDQYTYLSLKKELKPLAIT